MANGEENDEIESPESEKQQDADVMVSDPAEEQVAAVVSPDLVVEQEAAVLTPDMAEEPGTDIEEPKTLKEKTAELISLQAVDADGYPVGEDGQPIEDIKVSDRLVKIIEGAPSMDNALFNMEGITDLNASEQITYLRLTQIKDMVHHVEKSSVEAGIDGVDLSKFSLSMSDPSILRNMVQKEIEDLKEKEQKEKEDIARLEAEDAAKNAKEAEELMVATSALLTGGAMQEWLSPSSERNQELSLSLGADVRNLVTNLGKEAIYAKDGSGINFDFALAMNPAEADILGAADNNLKGAMGQLATGKGTAMDV